MEARPKVIVGADFIRLFAALLVVVFHLGYMSWTKPESLSYRLSGGTVSSEWALPFTWFGSLGVPIFFVLSGFVIAFSVGDSARDFIKRRAIRLIPAAWICAPITFAFVLGMTNGIWSENFVLLLRSMVFWPVSPWIDNVYWTLPLEIAFYALVGLLVAWKGQKVVPSALCCLAAWSAMNWAIRAGAKIFDSSFTVMGQEPWLLLLGTHGCFFALGGLIYYLMLVRRNTVWLAFCIISFGTSTVSVAVSGIADAEALGRAQWGFVPIAVFVLTILALVVSIKWNERIASSVGHNWPRTAGIMTYPLYLSHNAIGGATLALTGSLGLAIGTSLLVAYLIAQYAEPFVRSSIFSRRNLKAT